MVVWQMRAFLSVIGVWLVMALAGCGGGGSEERAKSVSMSSSSPVVPADGSSYANITVTVVDKDGAPLPAARVSLSTTLGTLSRTTDDTDRFGQVTVRLTAPTVGGAATVTATANGYYASTSVQFQASAASLVTLTASPAALAPGASTTLTAQVRDATGNALASMPVVFSVVGTPASGGALGSTNAVTDANGRASVTYLAGSGTGNDTLRVTTSDGQTAQVVVSVAQVNSLTLTANPASLRSGAVSDVVATVLDAEGKPVSGLGVTFGFATNVSGARYVSTPTSTTGTTTQTATTDAFGRASVYYKAGAVSGTDLVEVITANGLRLSANVAVSGSGAMIGGLTLTAANSSIPADGTSTVALTAQVQDTAGQPLANQSVSFGTTAGTLSAASATTDAAGMARITLRSSTQATIAVVTASTGGFNATQNVVFGSGAPGASTSAITAQPSSLPADGVSTSTVTVVLRDANNNTVADGTPVTLQASAGTVTSANPASTVLGRATFTLRAPNAPATATLSLLEYPSVPSASVSFGSVVTGVPANITVSVANPALFVTGVGKTDSTSIVVTVKDAAGALISDANAGVNNLVVTFRSKPNGGETVTGTNAAGTVVTSSTSIAVRTTNGVATLTLQAGTLPGVVELEVEALSSAGVALVPAVKASLPQVSIASGPPHNIALSYPVAGVTNLGGGVYRRIGSASVTDRYGNAVPDGTVISLGLLDSVIASNTTPILSGGAASDASTTAASATLTEVDSTWTTASVTRNGVARSLQANDRVLLINAVAGDKSRFLTAAPAATSATVQKNYTTTAAGLEYMMGAALLGGQISGVDAQTGLTQTGRATTQNGVATIYVTYPADREHILTGCYGLASATNHTLDIRTGNAPAGSAQVWVVAESTESGATSLDNRFCFAAIGPYKLPSGAGGTISGTTTITFDVRDQNDILLPFIQISPSAAVTTDTGVPLTVTFGNCSGRADQRTTEFGTCSLPVTVGGADSGDAATITIGAGDATPISITLTVP